MDYSTFELLHSATATVQQGGAALISTGPDQWAYAAVLPGAINPSSEVLASIDIEVAEGSIGVVPLRSDGGASSDSEIILRPEDGRKTLDIVLRPPTNAKLCLRNTASGQSSKVRVFAYETCVRRSVNIDGVIERLLTTILLYPAAATSSIARALGIPPNEVGAIELTPDHIPLDLDAVFYDDLGRFLVGEYHHQCDLLLTYDSSKTYEQARGLGPGYFNSYFRQCITRVYHLVTMLRELGLHSGTILEVGSLFGTFAGPLARLGYDVTAVDRYRQFEGALDGYINDLRSSGVDVVATGVEDEAATIARLGRFDAVISMAVIEHIPHTPRDFLMSLAGRVRPGGILALDTPNIAQYWHRRRLQAGRSIHQDIARQFFATIPFEGHHREYTAAEMKWMLEQVGCTDVRYELFDYNIFQFDRLSRDHIDAMLAMVSDPTLADTVLVAGRVMI